MIIYDKDIISKYIKLEKEEPLFLVSYNPNIYSLRKSFNLYILFAIYFILFIISEYLNRNYYLFIILIIILMILMYFSLSFYYQGKGYKIIFTDKRLIQIINNNIYSINNDSIYDIKLYQNLYEKLNKLYTLRIYTSSFLVNKDINTIIDIILLKKEDLNKILDIINKNRKNLYNNKVIEP
ncbi:hypothetical protein MJ1_0038 [Nanobdella aerobiophila]|uniref:Uncharacterized protein n=1 Tax=Nanobdella aerobiophila TaxID=2586965 RepID=A0A915S9R9_9ARCH|nr:hypothetical protein [Nanobdella aerobiophila]BBL45217.1 hypothetical protein MJ1_0038 [Nanobdella aerobiophila]